MDQTIIPPDEDDILLELKNEIFADLNCVEIGKLQKVNSNQTVEILIQVKRRVSGTEIAEYPLLVDCPYFVLSGGNTYVDMPIEKDDKCIVLFNDRNIDTWWSTENVKEPPDRRKHNLSDGMALIGIGSDVNFFSLSGDAIGLRAKDKKVRVDNDLETLKTLMDDFIDAVVAIVTVGSATTQVLNPASQAALTAVKTRMALLLAV